ncbi:MAG TPA: NAD(P)-binding domain-containing protein, partial [Burkholderiales bacterium]
MDTQRKPALGFIGLGQMGEPMVRRLLAAGYPVAVWNRSRDKLAPALERGAQAVPSPADVA